VEVIRRLLSPSVDVHHFLRKVNAPDATEEFFLLR
jgi:hypothetical protein